MNDQVNIIELNDASSLAKIISSKTAQEIIKFIGDNEKCTATDIKEKLNLPASTVHYNLKALIDSKIIDDSEFSYSSKGKQVIHYSLTNKILIIVPQKQNISAQLKAFIPGLLTVGGIIGLSLIIKLFKNGSSKLVLSESSSDLMVATMNEAGLAKAAPMMADMSVQSITTNSVPWYFSSEFLIGLIVASACLVGTYMLFKFIQKKRRTHQ
ncbi:winged helix-turn-helix transcriptional regulator [Candidatus Woesearchaeota archaeon]|nr:winged helix-turn-helix transcriptional regulator [Candidatus Woesearchaeota archaeon]